MVESKGWNWNIVQGNFEEYWKNPSAEKKQAEVKLGREIDDSELVRVISNLGYKVVSIESDILPPLSLR